MILRHSAKPKPDPIPTPTPRTPSSAYDRCEVALDSFYKDPHEND
jgi:hypothetical protein